MANNVPNLCRYFMPSAYENMRTFLNVIFYAFVVLFAKFFFKNAILPIYSNEDLNGSVNCVILFDVPKNCYQGFLE